MTFIFKGLKKKFSSSQSTSSDSSLPVPLSVGKMLDSKTPIIQSASAIATMCLQVADFPQMLSAALGDIDIALVVSNDWYCTHEREFDIVECVMSISDDVTREQLDFVSSRLEETLGIKTLATFIHKEQGYFSNGKIHYDPHVHLICDFRNVKKYRLRYELPSDSTLKEKAEAYAQQYDKMSTENLSIQAELDSFKRTLPDEKEKARKLGFNEGKQKSYENVRKELEDYSMKCRSLEVQLSQTSDALHTVENDYSKVKAKLSKLQAKSDITLKKALAEKESAWQIKLDTLVSEAVSKEKDANIKNIEKWENNNHELVKILNDRESLISRLQEQISQLTVQLDTTEKTSNDNYTNWCQVVDENSELSSKLAKANQEIKELSSSGSSNTTPIYEELSSVRKELSKTQKELSESKKLIAAQVAQIGELNTEIEGLQKRNDTNYSDSSLLSQKDEEINLLKSDKVELNRKISEQEILIKKLQETKD